MALTLNLQPLPLTVDDEGVVRIGGTRVTLDTLVAEFESGATAEEIVADFPVLDLADVYAVIGYYLRERDAVEVYLRARGVRAELMQSESRSRYDSSGLRERLLARRESGRT